MTEPVGLRNFKGRVLYMAMGDYRPLVPILSFKTGLPRVLEQAALNFQYHFPKRSAKRIGVLPMIEKEFIQAGLAAPQTALLYNSAWYKRTQWFGVIGTS